MASPYSTPRYPGAPNPTPRSTQKGLRPPIHNPYDKFTQPEFDAWIGDITGALKRALGREEAPLPVARAPSHPTDEEGVEDSFAEVKARRLAKGKERARDEDLEAEAPPVQEDSDEEDRWGVTYSGEDYSDGESGSGEESEEEAPRVGEAEVIDLLSDDEDEDEGVEDEGVAAVAEDYDEEAEGSDAGSEDNDDNESPRSSPAAGPSHVAHSYAHEVTEILDSDEEQEEPEEQEEERAVPARFQRKPATVDFGAQESDEGENSEEEVDEEQEEEEADAFPPREQRAEPVDVADPWRGPATYAEDFYSGGDISTGAERGNPHILSTEDDAELPADESVQTPDLPDPWDGPKKYAEDFYDGGDVPTSAVEDANPHTLPAGIDPAEELPVDEPVQTPDLSDPWEGPRNFAEDFYAGGDALPNPADGATPSHLTPKDEGGLFIPGISPGLGETKADVANAPPPGPFDIDDLYADADEVALEAHAADGQDEDGSSDERSPSPPSATLRTHVDWNWPPAFPGRVATRPGHIEGLDREVFDISDDEEDELAPSPEPASDYLELAAEQPPVSIQAVEAQPEPAEDKPQLPELDTANDASTLYSEFDEIYDMNAAGAPFTLQSSFEPISPPGLDFGDLPVFAGAFGPAQMEEINALDAAEAPPALEIPAIVVAEGSLAQDEVPTATSDPARNSVSLGDVAGEDELQLPAPAEPDAIVVEAEDDDDIRSSAPPEDNIDVFSVHDPIEVFVTTEYFVEEVSTGGRGTEEPEHVVLKEGEAYPPAAPSDASREPLIEEAAPSPAPEDTEGAASDPTAKSEQREVPAAPAALERTRSSSDFPPPISANPDVPDPASLSHTPRSPASPEPARSSPSAEGHDANSLPANAALHPLFRKLAAETRTRSPSGLFTPLTDGHSASVTPEGESSPKARSVRSEAQSEPSEVVAVETEPVEVLSDLPEVDELAEEDVEPIEKVVEPTAEDVASSAGQLVDDYDSISSSREASPEVPFVKPITQDDQAETERRLTDSHPADENGVTAVDFTADQRDATPDTDVDADAEGEEDPEYALSVEVTPEATTEASEMAIVPETGEENVEQSIDEGDDGRENKSSVEPELVKPSEDVLPAPEAALDSESADQALSYPTPEDKASPVAEAAMASSLAEEPATADADDEVRPLKRKRGTAALATRIPRLTRSKTSRSVQNAFMDHVEKKVAKTRATKAKGKGKRKATAESDEDEADNASVARSHSAESTSGGSSAAAQKMLVPSSRGTSRASSVASNAPSAYSGLSQPSPTIDRLLPSNGHYGPPPPFIHTHGILHHHHGRPQAPAPVAPVVQKRQPSEPPASLSVVAKRASAEPGPSSQPVPSKALAMSSTSSPVTRSNCRFHTVSVLKDEDEEEDGPRILFAVPGCSLGGNAELMKDEEIKDQGYVKAEDIPRLIRDVESLNFTPYVVGILRQLVGVDLLREQEVFYIPRADDGVVLKAKKKSHRAKLKQRESISARAFSNGGVSRAKGSSSMAPPSQASVSTSGDSVSTAGKLSQRGSLATSGSLSGSDLSDLEDDAPPTKRVKEVHADAEPESVSMEQPPEAAPTASEAADAGVTEENAGPSTATSKSRKLQPRRSRRLGVDALAYKPEVAESDGSGEDDDAETKKKRKKGGKRGVKRTRTEENGEAQAEETSEQPKRRRVRASTSNGHKSAADTEEPAS